MGSGKPRGIQAARKLRVKRRLNKWADLGYKKAHQNAKWKKPFAGASHAAGIVVEKIGVEAKQPNSAVRKCVRVQLRKNNKRITAYVPRDGGMSFVDENDEVFVAGFGRSGHAVGDLPGVRFKIIKVAGAGLLALWLRKKGVPFLDEGAELVTGDADTDEVGVAVELLDLLNLELDDSPCILVLVLLVQVGVGDLEDAALEGSGGNVESSLLVARGQSGHANLENGGSADTVPLLVHEWVLRLLLVTTLAFLFEVSRVLSGSHVLKFRSDNRRGGLPSY